MEALNRLTNHRNEMMWSRPIHAARNAEEQAFSRNETSHKTQSWPKTPNDVPEVTHVAERPFGRKSLILL